MGKEVTPYLALNRCFSSRALKDRAQLTIMLCTMHLSAHTLRSRAMLSWKSFMSRNSRKSMQTPHLEPKRPKTMTRPLPLPYARGLGAMLHSKDGLIRHLATSLVFMVSGSLLLLRRSTYFNMNSTHAYNFVQITGALSYSAACAALSTLLKGTCPCRRNLEETHQALDGHCYRTGSS